LPFKISRTRGSSMRQLAPSGMRLRPSQWALLAAVLGLTSSCWTYSRLHTQVGPGISRNPSGTLLLAQVMGIATREDVKNNEGLYRALVASGVPDSDIHDGILTIGRVECCGGPNERSSAMLLYVPNDMSPAPQLLDIVEVRVGREASGADPGVLNTVTRVRQKAAEQHGSCRWEPPEKYLWMRYLYCDWMPAEGWTKTQFAGRWIRWVKVPTP
jgi:hypothetical protein